PSVIFVSDGKQTPFTNNCSATSPPITSYSSKNGCKCIGFHTGLDSMFSTSKASISSVDVTSPCNVIHDNQKFGASHLFSVINVSLFIYTFTQFLLLSSTNTCGDITHSVIIT